MEAQIQVQTCFLCTPKDNLEEPPPALAECLNCKKKYCGDHSSKIDPRYCQICIKDVSFDTKVMQRVDQDWDVAADKPISQTNVCRLIIPKGLDWPFLTKTIATLDEAELQTQLEYHRAMVIQIELEQDQRKVKTYQKQIAIGNKILTVSVGTKPAKKERRSVNPETLVEQLKKSGLSVEQILNMLKGQGQP